MADCMQFVENLKVVNGEERVMLLLGDDGNVKRTMM